MIVDDQHGIGVLPLSSNISLLIDINVRSQWIAEATIICNDVHAWNEQLIRCENFKYVCYVR